MLGIETKLSTVFYHQTDGQTEKMNQELEQYLKFFIDHRQKNQQEWLVSACNKQQSTLSNQNIIIYSKLQKRVENGSRYQKEEKDRKSNGFCRKDEKGTRESRSIIEESTEKNKAASR